MTIAAGFQVPSMTQPFIAAAAAATACGFDLACLTIAFQRLDALAYQQGQG